jgi:hypothetical protein
MIRAEIGQLLKKNLKRAENLINDLNVFNLICKKILSKVIKITEELHVKEICGLKAKLLLNDLSQ